MPLVVSENVIEADVVRLTEISAPGSSMLSPSAPNFVRAFRVEIAGVIKTKGQVVTIVAHDVTFLPGGMIDISGADALETWAPAVKPLPPASLTADLADGAKGERGHDAGNLTVYAESVTGIVKVTARGGQGARGQDGGDGAKGEDYAGPPPADIKIFKAQPPFPPLPAGFPGGKGGKGGHPGRSGDGGNGGSVNIWVPPNNRSLLYEVTLDGGAPGAPASPGDGGPGGIGGEAPRSFFAIDGKRSSQIGPRGPSPMGDPGDPIRLAVLGTPGKLNGGPVALSPPALTLPDGAFAAQCTAGQLWHVLKSAELSYFNDSVEDAVPRLIWIYAVAPVLQSHGSS